MIIFQSNARTLQRILKKFDTAADQDLATGLAGCPRGIVLPVPCRVDTSPKSKVYLQVRRQRKANRVQGKIVYGPFLRGNKPMLQVFFDSEKLRKALEWGPQ